MRQKGITLRLVFKQCLRASGVASGFPENRKRHILTTLCKQIFAYKCRSIWKKSRIGRQRFRDCISANVFCQQILHSYADIFIEIKWRFYISLIHLGSEKNGC